MVPREVAAVARERGWGPHARTDRRTPETVVLLLVFTPIVWAAPPLIAVVAACTGHWRTEPGLLCLTGLSVPLGLSIAHWYGWRQGALYCFSGGLVLRRFRSVTAYAWTEVDVTMRYRWEHDAGSDPIRQAYRVVLAPDGSDLYVSDHALQELQDLRAAARAPKDAIPAGYEDGPRDTN